MNPSSSTSQTWTFSPHECLAPGFLVRIWEEIGRPPHSETLPIEIIRECLRTKASDFDAIPNRRVSLNTPTGTSAASLWPSLTQDQIVSMLGTLFSWKFQNVSDEAQRRSYLERLEHQLLSSRKADFGCTVPVAMDPHPAPRVRAHVYLSESGLGFTCRILSGRPPSHRELGLPDSVVQTISALLQKKSGLGLVTGPTGSGKSSTLAAFLNAVRLHHPRKIVTIEDPIEILYEEGGVGSVIQQEVGRDVSSFADGLHAVLRKRPDIILLGEIRDAESMQTCLEATQTGHLILATLHTRGVTSTLRRITELFPPEKSSQILGACADSLLFILSQGLLPRQNSDGRALACEFMVNRDSSRHAISKFLTTPQALREVIKKPHNIEWNTSVRSLMDRNLIDEQTSRDALLEEGQRVETV